MATVFFSPLDMTGWTPEQRLANARLIAAAPDLLAACESILERGYVSACIEEERADHDLLVAAIAKTRAQITLATPHYRSK